MTTPKGLLQPQHASMPTALPRVSLNGDYQHPRYIKVFLSGAPLRSPLATRGQRLRGRRRLSSRAARSGEAPHAKLQESLL